MDISGIGGVINGIISFLGSLDLSGEKKAELKLKLEQLRTSVTIAAYEDNKAALQSDSWLAKNIRPLMAFAIFSIFTTLSFQDAVEIATLTLWSGMLNAVIGFYFGGRTLEKISRIVTQRPSRSGDVFTTKKKRNQKSTFPEPWERERSTER